MSRGGAMSGRIRASVAAFAAAAIVASLLAACGGGSGSKDTAKKAEVQEAFDPNGVVRWNFDLTQVGGVDFDPLTRAPGFYVLQEFVYETLLRKTPSGGFESGLAQSVKIVDPRTLDVTL